MKRRTYAALMAVGGLVLAGCEATPKVVELPEVDVVNVDVEPYPVGLKRLTTRQ